MNVNTIIEFPGTWAILFTLIAHWSSGNARLLAIAAVFACGVWIGLRFVGCEVVL